MKKEHVKSLEKKKKSLLLSPEYLLHGAQGRAHKHPENDL